jgi:hypothetical protein
MAGQMGTQARWAKWVSMAQIKVWRVVLGSSLRHVGQHGTTRFVIRAVPSLPLRHGHDANRVWTVLTRPDLQD